MHILQESYESSEKVGDGSLSVGVSYRVIVHQLGSGGNQLRSGRWKKNWKKASTITDEALIFIRTKYKKPKMITRAQVSLTRFAPKMMDWDNCMISFKPLIDACISGGLIEDDSPRVIIQCPQVSQIKCRKEDQRMVIEIWEI